MTAPDHEDFFFNKQPLLIEYTHQHRTTIFTTTAVPISDNNFRVTTTGNYDHASSVSFQVSGSVDTLKDIYVSLTKKVSKTISRILVKDKEKLGSMTPLLY